MANSGNNVRSSGSVLKADHVEMDSHPFVLAPAHKHGESGRLTLSKENGLVKGFEYQCVCGHKDYFVCE
jgi:hypothetical protein